MALETMMYYCKFNQVAIPLATTVPDVSFSAEPVLLVSGLQHTATDFANPFPTPTPVAISQDDEGMLTFAWAEKAVDYCQGCARSVYHSLVHGEGIF